MKRRFIVEIDVPEETGDLCWDQDETGLQALHDCIISPLTLVSLNWSVKTIGESNEFKDFIKRQNAVRSSFKVIRDTKE